MSVYDHTTLEEKWLAKWEADGLFQDAAAVDGVQNDQNKMYLLFAFAYPSGSGLHVGHVESKTALDILARYYRMNGKQVFFPVGWDAFGLPAENYAIKTGTPPAVTTKNAIDTFRRQIKRLGISYDWKNEIATSHPGYYKWTQWLFLQLYSKGLAYQGKGMVNWCPSCQTVLANEQVVNGTCERCGTEVIQKEMTQWFFKITDYKDELIAGLDQLDWPEATKQQQLHWIGKSEGLSIDFSIKENKQKLTVWTKFWETVFGVTFLVIAPEKLIELDLLKILPESSKQAVLDYLEATSHKTEEERKIGAKDKTGVDTGLQVINPVNGQEVSLWVADYVLTNVGTGVVMGVPSHDERDFAFAQKFGFPVIQVVEYQDKQLNDLVAQGKAAYEREGSLVNSGQFDGLDAWGEGKQQMAEWMIEEGFGQWQTTYRLRDWLISRQRYWGAPIPIVYDPEGKPHPVKQEHLPWLLPTDVDFKPTGESPLKSSKEFLERTERLYGQGWRPEFDTMDTFVDSSWYYLRYTDSRNQAEFASKQQLQKWLPVDFYMIGREHIVLHLLYSRFFTKFLRDQGYLNFDEPFLKMRHQGMILGPDGKKMSKSKGNVINPDEIIEKFGADTLRMYEMFMGPIEADKPWDVSAVAGIYRFLTRVQTLVLTGLDQTPTDSEATKAVRQKLHQTLKKVTEDIPALKFNTAIAALMELMNTWDEGIVKSSVVLPKVDRTLIAQMLAPLAPFLAEELYHTLTGNDQSVHHQKWPVWDSALAVAQTITIPVQVNGKVRGQLEVGQDQVDHQAELLALAKKAEGVGRWMTDKKIIQEIYVRGRIINLVVE